LEYYVFALWNIWVSISLLFCIKIHFNVNGKAIMWFTPCLFVLYLLFALFVCNIEISQTMASFVVVVLLVSLESSWWQVKSAPSWFCNVLTYVEEVIGCFLFYFIENSLKSKLKNYAYERIWSHFWYRWKALNE
jgi:hypothetical protein